jgi:hypothetical protein
MTSDVSAGNGLGTSLNRKGVASGKSVLAQRTPSQGPHPKAVARAEGVSGLLRAARQSRFSARSYMRRKTSRGDIIIGRPALIDCPGLSGKWAKACQMRDRDGVTRRQAFRIRP